MNGVEAWKRRHAADLRLPPLDCGRHSDPWVCDCVTSSHSVHPSDVEVDAYRSTAVLLLNLGLTPSPDVHLMRALWRRGGEDRALVSTISSRWEVAA